MPGKQNTYTLGEYGVNRVKSPIHLVDGELLTAQNADVPFEKGNRGLAKRRGMAKLNEVAAAGPILSMTNIPIPDPFPDPVVGDTIHYGFGAVTRASSDGTTWADTSVAFNAASASGPNQSGYVTDGWLYYPGSTAPIIKRFDGSTVEDFVSLPDDPHLGPVVQINGLAGIGSLLFALAALAGGAFGGMVVYRIDLDDASVTKFCEGFVPDAVPPSGYFGFIAAGAAGLVAWQGTIWVCAGHSTGGPFSTRVYSANPSAGAWSLDHTIAGTAPTTAYGADASSLWLLVLGSVGSELYKRSTGGSYSVVLAASTHVVYAVGDVVYIAGDTGLLRSDDDGGSFTDLFVPTVTSVTTSGGGVTFDGDVYLFLPEGVYRDDGAVATQVDGAAGRWGVGIL